MLILLSTDSTQQLNDCISTKLPITTLPSPIDSISSNSPSNNTGHMGQSYYVFSLLRDVTHHLEKTVSTVAIVPKLIWNQLPVAIRQSNK